MDSLSSLLFRQFIFSSLAGTLGARDHATSVRNPHTPFGALSLLTCSSFQSSKATQRLSSTANSAKGFSENE